MERVLGIGGHFLRASDPAALGRWYRECLGLDADANGLWVQEPGPTVFAAFDADTDYFGSPTQQTMLNFRVRDLEAMLAKLNQNQKVREVLLSTGDLVLRPDHIQEENAPPEWAYFQLWMEIRTELTHAARHHH